jgi:hypothetical protein
MIQILEQGPRNATVLVTDAGTIAMSSLSGNPRLGAQPAYVSIMSVKFSVGTGPVAVLFDATTDGQVLNLTETQDLCFEDTGGLVNPKSAGYTGNVNVTGTGPFTLVLELKKHY